MFTLKLMFSAWLHISYGRLSTLPLEEMKLGRGGDGITKILNESVTPMQLSALAVMETVMVAESSTVVLLVALNAGMLPLPLCGSPILVLLFVQVKEAFGDVLLNGMPLTGTPLQYVRLTIVLIAGVGLTVTFTISVVTQRSPVINLNS
jgi:hypothetical protein